MVKVRSKKPHRYNGIEHQAGELYQAEERFVPVLARIGWAEPHVVPAAPAVPVRLHRAKSAKRAKRAKKRSR